MTAVIPDRHAVQGAADAKPAHAFYNLRNLS